MQKFNFDVTQPEVSPPLHPVPINFSWPVLQKKTNQKQNNDYTKQQKPLPGDEATQTRFKVTR